MTCSPFQVKANRINASLSTGPRTAEGKARSRRNSTRHGLTGSGIVLPREDEAEVQERFDALETELKPNSVLARVLVQRVALFSIRMERCARNEAVHLSRKIRGAEAAFDAERAKEVVHLMGELAADPASAVRALRAMPEGIERLVAAWHDLRNDLTRDAGAAWTRDHRDRAEALAGRRPEPHHASRFRALDAGLRGETEWLDPTDLAPGDVRARCRDELARLIDAEVADLRAEFERIDHDAIAIDRDEAADRALFDPSAPAALARKYEAAAERAFYKALDRLEIVQDHVVGAIPTPLEDEILAPAAPTRTETPPSLPRKSAASFFPGAPTAPRPPRPEPDDEDFGFNNAGPEAEPVKPPARAGPEPISRLFRDRPPSPRRAPIRASHGPRPGCPAPGGSGTIRANRAAAVSWSFGSPVAPSVPPRSPLAVSTLQRLADRGLIRPPRWLPGNVQYETIMGSTA